MRITIGDRLDSGGGIFRAPIFAKLDPRGNTPKKYLPTLSEKGELMGGTKIKLISLIITMALTVAVFAVSTVAFFTDDASTHSIGFRSGNLRMKLHETTLNEQGGEVSFEGAIIVMPTQSVSRIVRIENAGALDMYVRVALTPSITLSERESANAQYVDTSLIELNIDTDHWIEQDGYYYYYRPLAKGETTEPLFTEVTFSAKMGNMYKGSIARIDVVAYAVSSEDNGETAIGAQGWSEAVVAGGAN